MKLKINKPCDLSSISVLPPQSRRSSAVAGGLDSSSIYGRSQTAASQLRSQQPQQSQQSFSQGISSQHGLFSQFSQNSQDEVLTNEKFGSQERENSVKRASSCLPPTRHTREESQMTISRSSSNMMRKWSGPEHKCQISEELEHRFGVIETSINRLGMVLDSVQGDIMQVNKGTKEVALEMDGVRQKLSVHDDTLQLMNKGQEDIKNRLDMGLTSLSDELKKNKNHESLGEMLSLLSSLPQKVDHQMVKSQNALYEYFRKEMQVITSSMNISKQKQEAPPMHRPKAGNYCAPTQEIQFPNNAKKHAQKTSFVPNVKTGGWTSVKQERATSLVGNLNKRSNQIKLSPKTMEQKCRIVIESDEEIDEFCCFLKEKGTAVDDYLLEQTEAEAAKILRKAQRRKRKYSNTIIIN